MNILLIDDDIFFQKALSFNLSELGHSVTVAGDGLKAIEVLEKQPDFDIVFCDVMMPVLTGPGFLLMLKRYFPKVFPAIVVVSGIKDGEDFLKKIDTKFDYFVKKPVDMVRLHQLVEDIEKLKTNKIKA
jgi:CheY-like chemotaxis protein